MFDPTKDSRLTSYAQGYEKGRFELEGHIMSDCNRSEAYVYALHIDDPEFQKLNNGDSFVGRLYLEEHNTIFTDFRTDTASVINVTRCTAYIDASKRLTSVEEAKLYEQYLAYDMAVVTHLLRFIELFYSTDRFN